jgi:hypothetical protein
MSKSKQFLSEVRDPTVSKTFLVGTSGRKYEFVVNPESETGLNGFSIVDNNSRVAIKNIDVEDIDTFIKVLNRIKKEVNND